MKPIKSLNRFFNKIERTYNKAIYPIKKSIEHGSHQDTSYSEINFILMLISKLRLDFNKDENSTSNTLEEMLKGGHLKLNDHGEFYHELLTEFRCTLHKRKSSHQSTVQQYSFSGPVLKEVLLGVSEDQSGEKSTWIQFERHHTKTIIDFILHVFDYIKYLLTGKNIGPYGSSNHTENNPMIIRKIG